MDSTSSPRLQKSRSRPLRRSQRNCRVTQRGNQSRLDPINRLPLVSKVEKEVHHHHYYCCQRGRDFTGLGDKAADEIAQIPGLTSHRDPLNFDQENPSTNPKNISFNQLLIAISFIVGSASVQSTLINQFFGIINLFMSSHTRGPSTSRLPVPSPQNLLTSSPISMPDSQTSSNPMGSDSKNIVVNISPPPPGTAGSLCFDGSNATRFLSRFEPFCSQYQWGRTEWARKLAVYSTKRIKDEIQALPEFESDWGSFKKAVLKLYCLEDRGAYLLSRSYLESLSNTVHPVPEVPSFVCQFRATAAHLRKEGILEEFQAKLWLMRGLPQEITAKILRKFSIKDEEELKDKPIEDIYEAATDLTDGGRVLDIIYGNAREN